MIRIPFRDHSRRLAWCAGLLLVFLSLGSATAAAEDDFGQIVHEIEVRYHVHRNFRFLMGLAGLTVRVTHVAGAKNLKAALFADQHFDATGDELDELVMSMGSRGWQPLVRSFDHRSGEHTFIYARGTGKDLRVLLVTVERNDGVVMEMTVSQKRLIELIDRHQHPMHMSRKSNKDDARIGDLDQRDGEIDIAAVGSASSSGRVR